VTEFNAFEVVNTRLLPFSQARVFAAFADPAQLAIWWGPEGFTNEVIAFELEVGGRFEITMINENDRRFENTKRFTEVVVPERVVFEHLEPVHHFLMTHTFEAVGDHTQLTWLMQFAGDGENEHLKEFLHGANEQNFDRLEAFLEQNP
jgi:uncharacterized protein YndB with AHSA1/START domain